MKKSIKLLLKRDSSEVCSAFRVPIQSLFFSKCSTVSDKRPSSMKVSEFENLVRTSIRSDRASASERRNVIKQQRSPPHEAKRPDRRTCLAKLDSDLAKGEINARTIMIRSAKISEMLQRLRKSACGHTDSWSENGAFLFLRNVATRPS